VGIGLRSKYLEYFLVDIPQIPLGWLEVHPENYLHHFPNRKKLQQISERYPISFHCVTLSLGAEELPSKEHLDQLKRLMDEINPIMVSDHLSWNTFRGYGYNDLYPVMMTDASLKRIALHVQLLQEFFGRQLLVENPSTYVEFKHATYLEAEFLNALSQTTGCGIVLDINNLYVQSVNHGWDIDEYFKILDWSRVKEFHLAGHIHSPEGHFLIDTHNQPVCDDVWALYQRAIQHQPRAKTLIEWDEDLPDIQVLFQQAQQAISVREAECLTI
jgi:uncharacterized protein (UPF0276 family)